VTALFVFGPVLADIRTPNTVKVLLGLAVTMVVTPLAAASNHQAIPVDAGFLLLMAREAMVGMSMGYLVHFYFQGIRLGGDLINRHAGFSAAENFDPDTDSVIGPLGELMHLAILALFFVADGHHLFFAALARSYDVLPIGAWQLTPAFGQAIGQAMNDMSIIALAISFPVLTAVMAITMAEGVITRAVPQINILHVSFAVKIVLSLAVMYAGLPAAVAFMGTVIQAAQAVGMASFTLMH
jgi:flagellar biosynthetic protein FliR